MTSSTAPFDIAKVHRGLFDHAYHRGCLLARKRHRRQPGEWLKEQYPLGKSNGWWKDKSGFARRLGISHEMASRLVAGKFNEIAEDTLLRLASDRGWKQPESNDCDKRYLILGEFGAVLSTIGLIAAHDLDAVHGVVSSNGFIAHTECGNYDEFSSWVARQHRSHSAVDVDDVRCAGFYLALRPTFGGYPGAVIRAATARSNFITDEQARDFENHVWTIDRLRDEITTFFCSTVGSRKLKQCNSSLARKDVTIRHLAESLSKTQEEIDEDVVRRMLDIYGLSFRDYLKCTHGQLIERSNVTSGIAKMALTAPPPF